ncbi:MAG TPA: tetratricopeptide repeat protein, partial [Burkholderiaceae bacterium]|nr:tetratricopeptide repeat protein [Burkholderiaceae bacterium]
VLAAPGSQGLTVDFVPPNRRIREVVKEISEATVLAMYLNNLASEAMDGGRYDQAYQLVKQALLKDPGLPEAYNTLAVVLQRRGAVDKAELALRQSLALAPQGVAQLSNLLALLEQRGGPAAQAELPQLRERLAAVQPRAPFADMDEGQAALAQGDAETALAAFLRQREVTGDDARIEQLLAASYARLGRFSEAQDALRLALSISDNEGQRRELGAKKKMLLQARALEQ